MTITTNPDRTVSMRDTKPTIYTEVERLRALLEERDAELLLAGETIARNATRFEALSASHAELSEKLDDCSRRLDDEVARSSALEQRVANAKVAYCDMRAERDALKAKSEEQAQVAGDLNEIARRASILLKRTTQVRGGRVEQYVDGEWVAVPQRIVAHAAG